MRQLAAAFRVELARAATGSKLPAKESGSKLPHSKAQDAARLLLAHHARHPGNEERGKQPTEQNLAPTEPSQLRSACPDSWTE